MPTRLRDFLKKISDATGIPRYFVHTVAFEARLAAVRLYGLLPPQRARVRKLQRRGALNLIFGCGGTRYDGWVGVDCFFGANVDLRLDLRRRLPFQDGSVDYCYSEHFLEHLYPPEVHLHLREVHRILRPGGRYRIVVPAAMRFIEKYREKDAEFFRLAHPWEERPFDAMYQILNWQGNHRSIFDFEQMQHVAGAAGFASVRPCSSNQSPVPLLRIDRSEPQRIAESMYVELLKD